MQSSVNDALKSIDAFKDGIGTAQKTVRSLDPQSAKVLVALLDERMQPARHNGTQAVRGLPTFRAIAWRRAGDRLGALLNGIDRVLAAPTPYQVEQLQRTEGRVSEGHGRREQLRGEADPGDQRFAEEEQTRGAVMAGKPIEIPASGDEGLLNYAAFGRFDEFYQLIHSRRDRSAHQNVPL